MKGEIKVLVVDDSLIMRRLVSDILNQDQSIAVAATAQNGKAALKETIANRPDVVVMDMNMGEYDGLYAVKEIMQHQPTPIIMLSAVGNTDLSPIMKALDLGAFDYMNKPAGNSMKLREKGFDLVSKVKIAARTEVSLLMDTGITSLNSPHTFDSELAYEVVVIGSSTGGPTAVEKVVSSLPENLAIPVLIAQHMPENFIPSFCKRLNGITPLTVQVGRLGTELKPQNVYVAPGGRNMIVRRREGGNVELSFTKKVFKEFNGPSVNALMNSAAEVYGNKAIGVILTGMGKDGTKGVTAIKKRGGFTVAQSEDTCVVFGMPKEAIASGYIDHVVPIDEIGFFIVNTIA